MKNKQQAYAAMMIDEQRQAILISGESGAGKTESAKVGGREGGAGEAGVGVWNVSGVAALSWQLTC